MVMDPYRTLQVPRSATSDEIKRAYRDKARQYHPDKYVSCPDHDTKVRAASRFAACAAAYALLSDAEQKMEYDHVWKYGGYDSSDNDSHGPTRQGHPGNCRESGNRKRKSTPKVGIGYTCHDPYAYIWTRGKIHTRRTVAGIQFPSSLQNLGGLRFAFSSGHVMCTPSGSRRCTSRTTQISNGRKCTRKETHIYHPDGLKEVILEGDGNVERQFSKYTHMSQQKEIPWYWDAWGSFQDKLSACTNPCAVQASAPSQ